MAIYFDNSATTRVDERVVEAMLPFFSERYGNPSSVHQLGRAVRADFVEARKTVADLIGATEDEIIFTASGTESDNLAIRQIAKASLKKGNHLITCSIEHKAVLQTFHDLEKHGYEVTYLNVDKYGTVDLNQLKSSIRQDTTLISVMFANNEIGTIEPIAEISKIARDNGIYFHTDAVQAVGKIEVDVNKLGVDLLTFSGHKIYAPKGIGVLYVNRDLKDKIAPFITGGDQENGLRAGTENIPYIIGMSEAAKLIMKQFAEESVALRAMRDRFEERILSEIPETYVNGNKLNRIPNLSSVSFRFIEAEALMVYASEVCCSAGSACTSASAAPSHVLESIKIDPVDFHGTLRFSFGRFNTMQEVDKAVDILKSAVAKLREMSPLGRTK